MIMRDTISKGVLLGGGGGADLHDEAGPLEYKELARTETPKWARLTLPFALVASYRWLTGPCVSRPALPFDARALGHGLKTNWPKHF